jgi:CRISPR/Cas system-associated exonuclease Cas4 (RecB family)
MPTTSELLLEWDRRRVRSRQKEIGWSEVGGCRRRAGYRMAGYEPSNPSGSVQATMGTAIDEAINTVAERLGIAHQQTVRFLGIDGHFDRLEASEPDGPVDTVVDTKTVGTDRWLEHIEMYGPPRANQFQLSGYAAGLLIAGHPIRFIRIDYLARDTGREWSWRVPYDPELTRQAVEWLESVRGTDVDMLPRDYEPWSPFCRSCPFEKICWTGGVEDRDRRSVIWVEDPDTVRYARELKDARDQIKELTAKADRLAGVLDAVRPDTRALVRAGDLVLDFRPTKNGHAIYFTAPSKTERDGA